MSPHNALSAGAPEPFVLSPKGRTVNALAEQQVTEGMLVQLASRFPALVIRHEAQDMSRPTLSLVSNINATGFSIVDFALHVYEAYEREAGTGAPASDLAASGTGQSEADGLPNLPRVSSVGSVHDAPGMSRRKSSLLNKNGHASGASLNGMGGSMPGMGGGGG